MRSQSALQMMAKLAMTLLVGAALANAAADDPSLADRLPGMTLKQKVAQMFMVSFFGAELADIERDFLREVQPGAVVLFERNVESPQQATALTNAYQQTIIDAGGPPLLIAVDQEGGRIQRLKDGFTRFPAPMLWTAGQDKELVYEIGRAMALELRAVGVNMNLAPVADLNTKFDSPVIGRRSFGTDVELMAPILASFIRGMQDNGVAATAKHFPGHGDTAADSHLELPQSAHARSRLDAVELPPFIAAFAAGVDVVMVGHIWLTAFDLEPRPASLSSRIASGLLRDELGYGGLIMTDALDMDAIDTAYSASEAAVQAILAGNDLIAIGAHIGPGRIESVIDDVAAAVQQGRIAESRIEASARRILALKQDYGLLDWRPLDPQTVQARLNLAAHDELVTRLFAQGITAIDADGMIPLRGRALIVYPATRPKIADECGRGHTGFAYLGVSESPLEVEIDWAQTASAAAESIVVFTQNALDNPRQQRLVEALPPKKTIVAALWEPSDMLAFPDAAAYVLGYSPMLRATAVICEVLLGKRPALGQLPVRFMN